MRAGDSKRQRFFALGALLALLAGCVQRSSPPIPAPPPPALPVPPSPSPGTTPPPAPLPASARDLVLAPGPVRLGIGEVEAARAFATFRLSCPSLLRRVDASGLSRPEDWRAACADATGPNRPASFVAWFERMFEPVRVGPGEGFATGYYEPEIAGSRIPDPLYPVPVYRVPPDLVEVDEAAARAAGTPRRGRLDDEGTLIAYHDRAAIENGALAGRGLEIAWAADAIDLFFLQIQGSGRLRLPDGSVMRIGYASQNGREYVGIGRLLRDRGMLGPGQTSMQGIVAWLRANPDAGRAVMRENLSYVFFRELTGPGPLGALGLPVTPRGSVAADPRFVPLGAPVLLRLDRPEASGLWIAQDTGGAIRGPNRFDTFWGAGADAARIAGGMQGKGEAWLLLPRGALARRNAQIDARSDAVSPN